MSLEDNLKTHSLLNLNRLIREEINLKRINGSIATGALIIGGVTNQVSSFITTTNEVPNDLIYSIIALSIFFISGLKLSLHSYRIDKIRNILNYRVEQGFSIY